LVLIVFFFVFFIPTFWAIQFGSDFVNNVVDAMPPALTNGRKVASGIMPNEFFNGHPNTGNAVFA